MTPSRTPSNSARCARREAAPGRNRESGYALLFVYAMAATVAIMLYMAAPRVAFEAQRDKEQLLIDRGEQYSRAVQLYVRKFNRYPADLDALNNTQNLRFLRNRYVDPMTGKDEWRLVHVGPGGVFTDSLVYGNKKKAGDSFAAQNFITEVQQVGGNQADGSQGGANIGTRQRSSDQPGAPGDPNNPQSNLPPGQPGFPDPSQLAASQNGFGQAGFGQTGFPQQGQIQPGVPQPGMSQPGLPQFGANGQVIPNTGTFPGGVPTGQPGMPGLPPGVQLPPGVNMPGQTGQAPNVPAGANMINQILTTPRPGGLFGQGGAVSQAPTIDQYGNPIAPTNPALGNANAVLGGAAVPAAGAAGAAPGATPQAAAAPAQIGGGLAGVASKREQEGIKVYGDRKKYNEWEFVYDITKDKSRGGGSTPAPQPQNGQQQGLTGPGSQSPSQTPSPSQQQPAQPLQQPGLPQQTPVPGATPVPSQ